MTYDVGYRFAQALDPSGLDTIAACLHAIQAAAKDCRNAGKSFETDPAVVLLAQHLGAVATTTMPDRPALRTLCGDALSEIARTPLPPSSLRSNSGISRSPAIPGRVSSPDPSRKQSTRRSQPSGQTCSRCSPTPSSRTRPRSSAGVS